MNGMHLFVHSATECFTDHLPHGEGLIFHDYLKAMAIRGSTFSGVSLKVDLQQPSRGVDIQTIRCSCPLKSFRRIEFGLKANRSLKYQLASGVKFDAVWRGNPIGSLCQVTPETRGLPLIVGPIFRSWPRGVATRSSPISKLRPSAVAQWMGRNAWKQTVEKASLILATTPSLVSELRLNSRIRARVVHLPVIIDRPEWLTVKKPNLEAGTRVSWVGRFEEEKFPLLAIEAIEDARRRGLRVQLTMAGEGSLLHKAETYVQHKNLGDCVTLKGRLSNREVWQLHAQSHVHLSTSVDEPYGRGILESMAAGCVPLTHASGGPSEFLSNGFDAILVNQQTPEGFADELEIIIRAESLLTKMAENAIRSVERYSSESVSMLLQNEILSLKSQKHSY